MRRSGIAVVPVLLSILGCDDGAAPATAQGKTVVYLEPAADPARVLEERYGPRGAELPAELRAALPPGTRVVGGLTCQGEHRRIELLEIDRAGAAGLAVGTERAGRWVLEDAPEVPARGRSSWRACVASAAHTYLTAEHEEGDAHTFSIYAHHGAVRLVHRGARGEGERVQLVPLSRGGELLDAYTVYVDGTRVAEIDPRDDAVTAVR